MEGAGKGNKIPISDATLPSVCLASDVRFFPSCLLLLVCAGAGPGCMLPAGVDWQTAPHQREWRMVATASPSCAAWRAMQQTCRLTCTWAA